MLTAKMNNKTVFIYDHTLSLLKEWSNQKQLLCPDCENLVVLKVCDNKQSHFAHVSKDCSFPFRESESIEHEKGKWKLHQWLVSLFGEASCVLEHSIHTTKQRADTFVKTHQCAVEFQCSPIHGETWVKRHKLYRQANITDIWILGYSMHRHPNKRNPFLHKLNALERMLLKEYGQLIYYDVLTDFFILLKPYHQDHNTLYGQEFFYPATECFIHEEKLELSVKYDFFTNMQSKRRSILETRLQAAQKTDAFLKENKKDTQGEKRLASKKQITYIQHLLSQKKMTTPYKLHGLLRHEASAIIKKLLEKQV